MTFRGASLIVLMLALGGCGRATVEPPDMANLVFLTREDCVNTVRMHAGLDDALRAMHLSTDYQVIDLATLAATDARTGYPTPTVLYRDRDLFGLPVPVPPYDTPT